MISNNREIAIVLALNLAEKMEDFMELSDQDNEILLDNVEQVVKEFLDKRFPNDFQ